MKRVKAIIGYAIVIGLLATLLALELACIAAAVVPVVGIGIFVKQPVSPGDAGLSLLNLWRAVVVALFGIIACLGTILAVLLPYSCVIRIP
jgi:hypothetical protein